MTSHTKYTTQEIPVNVAIETLTQIADLEVQEAGGVLFTSEEDEKEGHKQALQTIEWLQTHDADSNIHHIRDIFKVILTHLRSSYKKESRYVTNNKTIEGIKSIMMVVSEAAKKFDQYLNALQKNHVNSVTQLKEYKQLQEFYRKKIDTIIDQKILSRWISGLSQSPLLNLGERDLEKNHVSVRTKHVFVDIETVRKDTEYELLMMRKEDGTRFFNPRLLRNIKLVCDFGSNILTEEKQDPLAEIVLWQDKIYQISAKNIIKSLGPFIDRFYKQAIVNRDIEIITELKKAFMALMLASNSRNLEEYEPEKNCYGYFCDFQQYLRICLLSREYQKMIAYSPQKSDKLAQCLLETIHATCKAVYQNNYGMLEMLHVVDNLISGARKNPDFLTQREKGPKIWSRLLNDYQAMKKAIKLHPNGPLLKVMEFVSDGDAHGFDCLQQHNVPNHWFDLHYEDKKINVLRVPSPTIQVEIQKALINEEFKGLLHHFDRHHNRKKHLLINLQDRTSWKEFSRCHALEQLQQNPFYSKYFTVVTLATDTDFYNQTAPYDQDEEAAIFLQHFNEHLTDESAGYCFPDNIKNVLFPTFTEKAFELIYSHYFQSKKMFTREDKQNFISLFYTLLILKLIEVINPTSLSLSDKDGIDLSSTYTGLILTYLKLSNQKSLSDADLELLNLILYAPSLIIRQRNPQTEPFNRFLSALYLIESYPPADMNKVYSTKVMNANTSHPKPHGVPDLEVK